MKLRKLLFNILVVALCFAFLKGIGILVKQYLPLTGLSNIQKEFLTELLASAIVVAGVLIAKKKDVFRFTLEGMKEGLLTGIVMILLSGLLILSFFFNHDPITASAPDIVLFVLFAVLIGICEEGMFRGIFQNAFHEYFGEENKKQVVLAIVTASTVFGLLHFANLLSGASLLSVTIQAFSAIAGGIVFGVVYWNSKKNLWACVLIHGFADGCSFLNDGMLSGKTAVDAINAFSWKNILSILIYMVIAVVLLITLSVKKKANKAEED